MTWTPRDYARDASDLTAEASDAALGELYAGRNEWDTPPSAADIARDEEWAERYWRERERGDEWWGFDRPDPWDCDPRPTPREHASTPDDPPF